MLDLIEKKRPAGLLVLLDDECKVPRGSWNGWLSKCKKAHTAHPRFVMKLTDKECFSPVVISYAERTFLAQQLSCTPAMDWILLSFLIPAYRALLPLCRRTTFPLIFVSR